MGNYLQKAPSMVELGAERRLNETIAQAKIYFEGGKKMANNELMDFRDRGNFDFFKFSRWTKVTEEECNGFKRKCQHVLEYAHATLLDMCLMGYHLAELKNSNVWQDVVNPKMGYAFWNDSFEDFCDYAFGFSNTRTSNLLRLAKFVKLSGDSVDFIDKKYKDYNTSQLIELASVYPDNRKFFNPDMTVKDMRAAKNYMKMGSFYKDRSESDFDLMKGMQAWEQRKQEAAEQKAAQKTETPKQLPGQMQMEGLTEVFEETPSQNPTSDLAERGGRVDGDLIEDVTPLIDPPETWNTEEIEEREETSSYTYEEQEEQDESEEPETPTEEDAPEDPFAETLTSREKVRNFLNGYKEWFDISSYFLNIHVHYWRNGAAVYAVETIARADIDSEPTTIVRYYWRRDEEDRAFEIPKNELWKYIVEKRCEL